LLNLKHLINIFKNPPLHIKDIVLFHFKSNFQNILKTYNSYLVENLEFEKIVNELALVNTPSKGFLIMLKKLLVEFMNLIKN
jgi:hypothetical protein